MGLCLFRSPLYTQCQPQFWHIVGIQWIEFAEWKGGPLNKLIYTIWWHTGGHHRYLVIWKNVHDIFTEQNRLKNNFYTSYFLQSTCVCIYVCRERTRRISPKCEQWSLVIAGWKDYGEIFFSSLFNTFKNAKNKNKKELVWNQKKNYHKNGEVLTFKKILEQGKQMFHHNGQQPHYLAVY